MVGRVWDRSWGLELANPMQGSSSPFGQSIDLAGEFRNFPSRCVPVKNALGTSPLNKGNGPLQCFLGAPGIFFFNGQSHLFNLVSDRRYNMGVSGPSFLVLFGPFDS
jgi:hypothetical protein